MSRLLILLASLAVVPHVLAEPLVAGYEEFVLDLLDERWLFREEVDWVEFSSEVLALSENSQGLEEFNSGLMEMFRAAGDHHSRILDLEAAAESGTATRRGFGVSFAEGGIVRNVYVDGPADRAGVRVGERIVSIDDVMLPSPDGWRALASPGSVEKELVVESADGGRREVSLRASEFDPHLAPSAHSVTAEIALIELPAHTGSGLIPEVGQYAELVRSAIAENEDSCGLIVDLRRNSGGNMWPVLEGILPLLPPGPAGSFKDPDGSVAEWLSGLGEVRSPIAVLMSASTASAGEALVVAFEGRQRTRFFGEATAGIPTSIRPHALPAGYWLYLAQGEYVDRVGQTYDGRIAPDVSVPVDWTRYGDESDPVVLAAVQWLSEWPECLP